MRTTLDQGDRLEQLERQQLTAAGLNDADLRWLIVWAGEGSNAATSRAFAGWIRAVATDELRRRRHRTRPIPLTTLHWLAWSGDDINRAKVGLLALVRSMPTDVSAELAVFLLRTGEMVQTLEDSR